MSKPRMAGDKLDEQNKESADAKEALSQSQRNKQIREEIGNDPERLAARIGGIDREKYDFDGYTDKQINMALQGDTFGDKDYERLTGKSISGDEPKPEPEKPKDEDPRAIAPIDSIPENDFVIQPDPTPGPIQGINPGPGLGYSINQDNDFESNVTGDNNVVNNVNDNSINGYAGDSQRFTNDYIKKFTQRFS